MKPLPELKPITEEVQELSPDTRRYFYLTAAACDRPLTTDEAKELKRITDQMDRAYAESQPPKPLTPDEIDELARINHSRKHHFPAPHEL